MRDEETDEWKEAADHAARIDLRSLARNIEVIADRWKEEAVKKQTDDERIKFPYEWAAWIEEAASRLRGFYDDDRNTIFDEIVDEAMFPL